MALNSMIEEYTIKSCLDLLKESKMKAQDMIDATPNGYACVTGYYEAIITTVISRLEYLTKQPIS